LVSRGVKPSTFGITLINSPCHVNIDPVQPPIDWNGMNPGITTLWWILKHRLVLYPLLGAFFTGVAAFVTPLLIMFWGQGDPGFRTNMIRFPMAPGCAAAGIITAEGLLRGDLGSQIHRVLAGAGLAFSTAFLPAIPARAALLLFASPWALTSGSGWEFNILLWSLRSLSWGMVWICAGIGASFPWRSGPALFPSACAGFTAGALGGLLFDPLSCGLFGHAAALPLVASSISLGICGGLGGFFLAALRESA
jgi:hypothetical protein